MINKFVFDVDGTLTESRRTIDSNFKKWFMSFQKTHDTYLVTGSDRIKTIEQIGEDIYNLAKRVYNCSGNSVWEQDKEIYKSKWKLEIYPHNWLQEKLRKHHFRPRTGWHFDERPGLCNFSIVGRNATREQRNQYVDWDKKFNDRKHLAKEFNRKFSKEYEIVAQVAGETGLDIMPIGKDKRQILKDFDLETDHIFFFGDKMNTNGNDKPLADANKQGENFHVDGWQHTWELLKGFFVIDEIKHK